MTTVIAVHDAPASFRKDYGLLYRSGKYRMHGRGLHNPHHPHVVEVWSNTGRPDGFGGYIDPSGKSTTDEISVLISAKSVVIDGRTRLTYEGDLTIGDEIEVDLTDGRTITGTIVARPLADPMLIIDGIWPSVFND